MEGRISRLDHHNRRFSAPPEYTQTDEDEARQSTHSTSEGFGRRVPVHAGTGTGASTTHRGAPPLRSALKRPGESRTSVASSSSSTISGSGSESIYSEPSTWSYSFPNRASTGGSERSSPPDARKAFSDSVLWQNTGTSAPVDPSFLVPNESPIRTSRPSPQHKQNFVSALISRLRTGGQPAGSALTPPTSDSVAPHSQPPLPSQFPCCGITGDMTTTDVCHCTSSDSDPDTPPSSNPVSSSELPVRKTVRFALWSQMRTFERPEWEPTGEGYEEATYNGSSYRGFLRKVWIFGISVGSSTNVAEPSEALM